MSALRFRHWPSVSESSLPGVHRLNLSGIQQCHGSALSMITATRCLATLIHKVLDLLTAYRSFCCHVCEAPDRYFYSASANFSNLYEVFCTMQTPSNRTDEEAHLGILGMTLSARCS